MRDPVRWVPTKMDTRDHGRRTVYVKHWWAPFAGLMAAADTAFTVPAYIRIAGKRVYGFVTPRDGMAYQQEHEPSWFIAYRVEGHQ